MPARRRRTRLIAAAALALGAGLGLTACGAPHPGSAAIVDGDRITVPTVQNQVNRLRAAIGPSVKVNLNQFALDQMISDRILDRALADQHVTVSDAQARALRSRAATSAGGEKALRTTLLQQRGVLPSGIDEFYRQQAGMIALITAAGEDPNDAQAGQAALDTAMGKALKEMSISVSPRYGAWNPSKMSLKPAAESWLKSA